MVIQSIYVMGVVRELTATKDLLEEVTLESIHTDLTIIMSTLIDPTLSCYREDLKDNMYQGYTFGEIQIHARQLSVRLAAHLDKLTILDSDNMLSFVDMYKQINVYTDVLGELHEEMEAKN